MRYTSVQLSSVYKILGRPGVLTVNGIDYPASDAPPLKCIDKSAGVSILGAVALESFAPAATVRAADILALGLTFDSLDKANLLLNSKNWLISSHKVIPSPNGETDGEVWLYLEGRD
jgi:hypothetical protein